MPDFGRDHEILVTESNTAAIEESLGHTWTPVKDEDDAWVLPAAAPESAYTYGDYMLISIPEPDEEFVGLWIDRAKNNEYRPPAHKAPWHNPYVGSKRIRPDPSYDVPDFGVDQDILDTHKNLRDAEAKIKGDNFVQLESTEGYRPPIDATPWHDPYVGSKRLEAPIYSVPDFGVDHEILHSQENLRNTEEKFKHKL